MKAVAPQTPVHIFGAGGMLAGEVLRLLANHPQLIPTGAITRTGEGSLADLHPHLSFDLPLSNAESGVEALAADLQRGQAVLVFALPHGETAARWRVIRERLGELTQHLWVVDLSADFRIADAGAWAATYGCEHADPAEIAHWTYGLVELNHAALQGCRRIAAPGCFATAMQLAIVPLLRSGRLSTRETWVLQAVTGSSGSGGKAKATTHHPHRNGNMYAYSLDGHRHQAELVQACRGHMEEAQPSPRILFQPHSGPFSRGIHLTAVLPLAVNNESNVDAETLRDDLRSTFVDSPFVHVRERGAPELRHVVGSNRAEVGVTVREGCAVVFVVIDNLIKGGAGQALQALNIALGLPETAGLPLNGLGTC
jgi:N-acetyl-gamma-glutamyl-phosphate reductase